MEGVEVPGAEQMIEEVVETEEAKSGRKKRIDKNERKYMVKMGCSKAFQGLAILLILNWYLHVGMLYGLGFIDIKKSHSTS